MPLREALPHSCGGLLREALPHSCGGLLREALPHSCGGLLREALPHTPLGSVAPQTPLSSRKGAPSLWQDLDKRITSPLHLTNGGPRFLIGENVLKARVSELIFRNLRRKGGLACI